MVDLPAAGLRAELPKTELARFREWLAEFEPRAWDRELEEDVEHGRLDALPERALCDHEAGKSTEL